MNKYIKNVIEAFSCILLLMLLPACSSDDESLDITGRWNVETYSILTEVNDEVLNDETFQDAGIYTLNPDGSGTVTLNVPGLSLAPNTSIFWSLNNSGDVITIDYRTGQEPFDYQLTVNSENSLTWLYETFTDNNGVTSYFSATIRVVRE